MVKLEFYSSFIFLVNVIISYFYKNYNYVVLFFTLWITSLFVHSNDNIYTNMIDKICILLVVIYGGSLFYKKLKNIIFEDYKKDKIIHNLLMILLIISTFLLTIYLYCYGYIYKQYCFYEEREIAKLWHSYMHFVGSFGHICIVIM